MKRICQQLGKYLMAGKGDRGLTLVELLVVLFIIGILSSIALPTFFRQADRAREVEAIQNVSNFGKLQQVNYIEKNGFTTNFGILNYAASVEETEYEALLTWVSSFIPSASSSSGEEIDFNWRESDQYVYAILAVGDDLAVHIALSKNYRWKTYATAVYPEDGNIKLCQPTEPISISLSSPMLVLGFVGDILTDPSGYLAEYTNCPDAIIPPLI